MPTFESAHPIARTSRAIRAMCDGDIGDANDVFLQAVQGMRTAVGLAPEFRSEKGDGSVGHLLTTDPGGSFVAEGDDGHVIGFSQAARRDDLWVLCHLFVHPSAQGIGIGQQLLHYALDYGNSRQPGLIASTPLPAAMTMYARLPGFAVHPMVSASGVVDRKKLASSPDVRRGGQADGDLIDTVGQRVRGGSHRQDVDYLLEQGATLLVAPDGYAVASTDQVELLAALSIPAATQLLSEALRQTNTGATVTIKRIGAGQSWASRLAVQAGMRLSPWGPLVARACLAPKAVYLPNSSFC